ncbi:cysteine hydrolase [Streptomyces sp. NBC_01318]|uniref:isochorismatase family protein n=1 Tax=unclassified Streptomyces TaxID=2593676 RepID=UPI002E14699F|nr:MULTISPECIES: isochorismatase family protein [unclassified Streptomyces]WSJ49088.1 cysteine hydrolase [Streptomyces sp. NBC_01318]
MFEALQEVVEGLVRRPGLVGGDGGGNRKIVLSTLIDAADRDYRVYVLTDGVADHHPDVHRILLDHVFPSRAHLIDTAQLAELLKAARPPRA